MADAGVAKAVAQAAARELDAFAIDKCATLRRAMAFDTVVEIKLADGTTRRAGVTTLAIADELVVADRDRPPGHSRLVATLDDGGETIAVNRMTRVEIPWPT